MSKSDHQLKSAAASTPASKDVDGSRGFEATPVVVTRHAVERYCERVEPSYTMNEAFQAIRESVSRGRAKANPRHWMRSARRRDPGTRYVYDANRSDICLLVRNDFVLTIYTRDMFKNAKRFRDEDSSDSFAGRN